MSPFESHVEIGHPLVRGALALYPLFGEDAVAPDYAPGPVASAKGSLLVGERPAGPSVPSLWVRNRGNPPVLLVEGETLLGGWQDRTLNVSVIVGAGAAVEVPVSCVERGRWGGHRDGAQPAPALAPTALRARKQRSVAAGVFAGVAGRHADQGAVWQAVDEYAHRFAVAAPTGALDDVRRERETEVGSAVADTTPLRGQRGIAVAVGGRLRAVDLFDRPATLEAYWGSLVGGHALDAIGVGAAPPPGPGFGGRGVRPAAPSAVAARPGRRPR